VYKPENQSQIGGLIQKIWSENQGHLTLYIFQKKISLSFHPHSIFIPSHFTSSFFISVHSISFFHFIPFTPFHTINKNPFQDYFHSVSLFLTNFVQLKGRCLSFRSWKLFPQLAPVSAARNDSVSTASSTLFSRENLSQRLTSSSPKAARI
jgi:hypothetical protein